MAQFFLNFLSTSMGFGCRHCRNTTNTANHHNHSSIVRYRWDSYLYSNTYFQKETYHQKNLSWLSMFASCVHHFRDPIEVCRSMHILPKEICFSMYEQRHTLLSKFYVIYCKILTISTISCIKIVIANISMPDTLGPYFDKHAIFHITQF